MIVSDWIKELKPQQLQKPYKQIAGVIGVENTVKLAAMFQGTPLYFPKFDNVINEIRNSRIRSEYEQGATYKELAIKYDLTERWVYEIIKGEIDENQISFFR